jgi:hypothetical protein
MSIKDKTNNIIKWLVLQLLLYNNY